MHIRTEELAWLPSEFLGIEVKPLASGNPSDRHRSALVWMAPGAMLPTVPEGHGFECFVLEGALQTPTGVLEVGGYERDPSGERASGCSASEWGCTLFWKTASPNPGDEEFVHLQTDAEPWLPGHGNLRVKPLHEYGTEGTALVFWPKGERFLPHRHFGGEEIFVLSGTFRDEHGAYPARTWIQSPHNSTHHPFVVEETVIWVRTGHLPPSV